MWRSAVWQKITDISEDDATSNKKQAASSNSVCWLFGLFFDPGAVGNMLLSNIGELSDNMVSCLRGQNCYEILKRNMLQYSLVPW